MATLLLLTVMFLSGVIWILGATGSKYFEPWGQRAAWIAALLLPLAAVVHRIS